MEYCTGKFGVPSLKLQDLVVCTWPLVATVVYGEVKEHHGGWDGSTAMLQASNSSTSRQHIVWPDRNPRYSSASPNFPPAYLDHDSELLASFTEKIDEIGDVAVVQLDPGLPRGTLLGPYVRLVL
jgi:hypothetical protein